jgi:ElaB/YqjD/DUF883 family membrane-anchored ribosome-binding protein
MRATGLARPSGTIPKPNRQNWARQIGALGPPYGAFERVKAPDDTVVPFCQLHLREVSHNGCENVGGEEQRTSVICRQRLRWPERTPEDRVGCTPTLENIMSTADRFGPLPGAAQEKIVELKGDFKEAAKSAKDTAEEAVTAAKDAWSEVSDTVLKTVRERPYTSLAVAAGVGFLYAVSRR